MSRFRCLSERRGAGANQRMKLTGAAILVSRGMKFLHAAPAAFLTFGGTTKGDPMRTFSRWMPPVPKENSIVAWCLIIAIYAAFWPILIFCHLAIRRHMRRLASERVGEDIGTFVRAFDRRSEPFDPWVLRATWDALSFYVTFEGRCLPLRPEDHLVKDLCIDPDDIDDLLPEVANRAGHSFAKAEMNPYYGRVNTVGEFVRFITLQPRLGER